METHIPDTVKGELVTFLSADKLVLHGFLVEAPKPKACIVYIHGMSGNFYQSVLAKAFARRAASAGYSTFMVNNRGHDWVSRGKIVSGKKGKSITIGTMAERFADSAKDIDGALRFLRKKGYRQFVLAGHSTGCQKVLYYQYKRRARHVRALLLLAPVDDYNLNRRDLGKRWPPLVRKANALVKARKGDEYFHGMPFAPRRFLSVADISNVESRLFNYDGPMSEFSSVKTPIFAAFGTKEEGAMKPVKRYMEILEEKSASVNFGYVVIRNARHSFWGYEDKVANAALRWLKGL